MTTLISSKGSKVAHLSWDGENPICGTVLSRDTLKGASLGFVQAKKRCEHCPEEGWFLYFDNLRRGQSIDADLNSELMKGTKGTKR